MNKSQSVNFDMSCLRVRVRVRVRFRIAIWVSDEPIGVKLRFLTYRKTGGLGPGLVCSVLHVDEGTDLKM